MGLTAAAVNRLILLLYRCDASRFFNGLPYAKKQQRRNLINILRENRNTDYGKKYRFADIDGLADFRAKVPITEYRDYINYIEQIANGRRDVLTSQNVNMFEVTGGSGGATKLIPYTAGLKQEFLKGTKPWIYALFNRYPQLKNGKSYWSITPPIAQKKYTKAGIPIGFEEDTAYFGKIEQFLMNFIMVRDKTIKHDKNMFNFYIKTSVSLLKEPDLSLISIWNPSYLLLILDFMNNNIKDILQHLPKHRRLVVREYIAKKRYDKLWPKLCVISCWCDGAAKIGAEKIKLLFPHVIIEPKGILATEAIMSIPYEDGSASILCYRSHYFEFLDMQSGELLEYTELKLNGFYEILLTTSGGFYRYRIRDGVKVESVDKTTGLPLLRFVGKTDKTSDHHGEKLNELFVVDCLNNLAVANPKLCIDTSFKLLSYENSGYVLFIRTKHKPPTNLAIQLDKMLCEAHHYNLCRELGQLRQVKVLQIYGDAEQHYIDYYINKGRKLGDIKPETLSLNSGWKHAFTLEEL